MNKLCGVAMPARRRLAAVLALATAVVVAGCAGWSNRTPAPAAAAPAAAVASTPPPAPAIAAAPAPPPAPVPPAPPPILPYDEAVLSAANNLLGKAQLPATPGVRHTIVIDPLIDGVTGAQSTATQAMGARIVELIRERYPQYEVKPFTPGSVAQSPLVLVGTFTGVNKERKTEGERVAYRICLGLADLKTGKLVSKGLAFASAVGVMLAPTPHFRDAPVVADDAATTGYIKTCQGTKAGDPINPLYIDRILAATMISEAMDAYGAGRYKQALSLYENVLEVPAGRQLRTYTGLYLTNWRLGHRDAAAKAFAEIVDQGLDSKRLGVKFLFRPGSTAFWSDPRSGATPYPLWLDTISSEAGRRQACLEIVGHTSATGPEPLNERLSLRRAEYVKRQIEQDAPVLARRMIASGVGSRETLVGNGRDDDSDALDRRVEFKVVGC
jgi:outer membrane protein OmpA-like peptidoglycan-associated protein